MYRSKHIDMDLYRLVRADTGRYGPVSIDTNRYGSVSINTSNETKQENNRFETIRTNQYGSNNSAPQAFIRTIGMSNGRGGDISAQSSLITQLLKQSINFIPIE